MLPNRAKTCLVALSTVFLAGCGAQYMPALPSGDLNSGYGQVAQSLPPTLPPGVVARSLTVSPATANGRVGESFRFSVSVMGSDGKVYIEPRLVIWSLSNPQLGTIDVNGVLVPTAAGTVKIMAMIGNLTAQASIQVGEAQFAWQQMISPVGSDLRAVKMLSPTEAWAAGDKGVMLHYLNGAWHKDTTFAVGDADIRGLGFANVNAGWAVGSRGGGTSTFISRWNGQSWTSQNLPIPSGTINAISVLNDHDAWAVGQDGSKNGLILHFDGSNWKAMESPGSGKLNGIQMLSAQSGWAVGQGGLLSTTPMILKYSAGTWVRKGMWSDRGSISLLSSQELTGIKMVSETQGYAVGINHQVWPQNPAGVFLTYDPKRDGWVNGQYDAAAANLNQVPLYAIDMISGTEGWALGQVTQQQVTLGNLGTRNPQSIFGNLLANAGGVLKADTGYFSGNLSGAFYGIDLLPQGSGFVVGQNGFILQRTYDWRGASTSSSSYGSYSTTPTTGGTQPSSTNVTYGPGGSQVPTTVPTSTY